MSAASLRVGLLSARWGGPGGVETVLESTAGEFLKRGHAVEALVLSAELQPGEVEERRVDGVKVRRVGWRYESQRALRDLIRTRSLEEVAAHWSADAGLDLVHVHHLSGWGLGLPARLAELDVPVLLSLHDYWPLCPRGQLFHPEGEACTVASPERCGPCWTRTWPQLESPGAPESIVGERLAAAHEAFAACSVLLVPSAAAGEVYARHGVDPARLLVNENGVARPSGAPPVAAENAAVRVGTLGAVQPSKGVLEVARVIDESSAPLTFEVHGPREPYHGDRAYVAALEELAARSERIQLHGPYARRDLGRILAELDLVVAPSRWPETHGLGAREARAVGLPVFASRIGGLDDPVFHLLPPDEPERWREALERFAGNRAWREELVARPYLPRSLRAMVDQLEALYLDLVR